MSKKKSPSKSKTKRPRNGRSIDHIPHCRRKPRTPASLRRRTDFSSLSIFPPRSSKGLLLESLNRLDKLITLSGLRIRRGEKKENTVFPLAACSCSQDTRRQLFSNIDHIPVNGVESVGQNALFEASGSRNLNNQNGDSMRNSESGGVCVAPGSVVWAKNASQHWWPAEVMDERSAVVDFPDKGGDGLVLIQYYGTRQSAWLDPASSLSEFDECFQKRSCNSTAEFQDALKQALHQREHLSLSKQFSGLSDDCKNQGYQSPDKLNSSSSSRTESPSGEMRRGKRERKSKLHFDEEPLPLKLARGVRRVRIMRSLGLAAPVGSPF